eukprot:jgi/Mesen1/9134/ME000058S08630
MAASYALLQERLDVAHASLQRLTVRAIFDRLQSSQEGVHTSGGHAVLIQCLTHASVAVVDQAVLDLCQLVQRQVYGLKEALTDLLAALAAVGSEAVPSICSSIGSLCRLHLSQTWQAHAAATGTGGTESGRGELWRTEWQRLGGVHPLLRAAQLRPEAHSDVLQQLMVLLIGAPPECQVAAWHSVQASVSGALLEPGPEAGGGEQQQQRFQRALHTCILRAACAAASAPRLRTPVVEVLVSHLRWYLLATPQEHARVGEAAEELVDALAATWRTDADLDAQASEELAGRLLEALVALSEELHLSHSPMLPALACLLKLVHTWGPEATGTKGGGGGGGAETAAAAAMVLFPCLHLMVASSPRVRAFAADVLRQVELITLTRGAAPAPGSSSSEAHSLDIAGATGTQTRPGTGPARGPQLFTLEALVASLWADKELHASGGGGGEGTGDRPGGRGKARGRGTEAWLRGARALLEGRHREAARRLGRPTAIVPLGIVMAAVAIHPRAGVRVAAAEALAAMARAESSWGVSILPVLLFCLKQAGHLAEPDRTAVQVALLRALPSCGAHVVTVGMVLQTLQPMLTNTSLGSLQAMGVRLVAALWSSTGRAFPQLEAVLLPAAVEDGADTQHQQGKKGGSSSEAVKTAVAASLYSVCAADADKGTGLVLTIQACMKSKVGAVRALGLRSLAALCREDVIDFYTAWRVVSKLIPSTVLEEEREGEGEGPQVAAAYCSLLQWGALDARAFPDAARQVLALLWRASLSPSGPVRAAAFEALAAYDVEAAQEIHPRPFQMLDPSSSSSSTGYCSLSRCSSALHLLLLRLQPTVAAWERGFQQVMVDALEAPPPPLAGGAGQPLLGLAALHSWLRFMPRCLAAKAHARSVAVRTTGPPAEAAHAPADAPAPLAETEAAALLLQELAAMAEDALPRVARNAMFAIAGLCQALPAGAHEVATAAADLLIRRLTAGRGRGGGGQEQAQVSAALALGHAWAALHVTEGGRKQEIAMLGEQHGRGSGDSSSNSALAFAAAGALGTICGSLLRDSSSAAKERETALLAHITGTLLHSLAATCPALLAQLQSLARTAPPDWGLQVSDSSPASEAQQQQQHRGEDSERGGSWGDGGARWGIVGAMWALGSAAGAMGRALCHPLLAALTAALCSWAAPDAAAPAAAAVEWEVAAGAYLALPACIPVAYELELLPGTRIDSVLTAVHACAATPAAAAAEVGQSDRGSGSGVGSGTRRGVLAACAAVGAGALLHAALSAGHALKRASVEEFLASMTDAALREGSMCALVGVANTLGAGVAVPGGAQPQAATAAAVAGAGAGAGDDVSVRRPMLLAVSLAEPVRRAAQQLVESLRTHPQGAARARAQWALGLCYDACLASTRVRTLEAGVREAAPSSSHAPDGALRPLVDWLLQRASSEEEVAAGEGAAVGSVLRCLAHAPRLPSVDWPGTLGRLMRRHHHNHHDRRQQQQQRQGEEDSRDASAASVRGQCLHFALLQAPQVSALVAFLDEMSQLSRLASLEPSLRAALLRGLPRLLGVFAAARAKQLLADVAQLVRSEQTETRDRVPPGATGLSQVAAVREALWLGLRDALPGLSGGAPSSSPPPSAAPVLLLDAEALMGDLIRCLPPAHRMGKGRKRRGGEWAAAADALALARLPWLLRALQVEGGSGTETRVALRAMLVGRGVLPMLHLAPCRTWLSSRSPAGGPAAGVERLVLEVGVSARAASAAEKHTWVLESMEEMLVCANVHAACKLLSVVLCNWECAPVLLSEDAELCLSQLPSVLRTLLDSGLLASARLGVVQKLVALREKVEHTVRLKNSSFVGGIHYPPETTLAVLTRSVRTCKHYMARQLYMTEAGKLVLR